MADLKEIKLHENDLKNTGGFIEKDGVRIPYFSRETNSYQIYETKHDRPCPPGLGEGVADDWAINEWVANHLPLKEEEKKDLIASLKLEFIKNERGHEIQTSIQKEISKKKRKKQGDDTEERVGVKDSHNSTIPDESV